MPRRQNIFLILLILTASFIQFTNCSEMPPTTLQSPYFDPESNCASGRCGNLIPQASALKLFITGNLNTMNVPDNPTQINLGGDCDIGNFVSSEVTFIFMDEVTYQIRMQGLGSACENGKWGFTITPPVDYSISGYRNSHIIKIELAGFDNKNNRYTNEFAKREVRLVYSPQLNQQVNPNGNSQYFSF